MHRAPLRWTAIPSCEGCARYGPFLLHEGKLPDASKKEPIALFDDRHGCESRIAWIADRADLVGHRYAAGGGVFYVRVPIICGKSDRREKQTQLLSSLDQTFQDFHDSSRGLPSPVWERDSAIRSDCLLDLALPPHDNSAKVRPWAGQLTFGSRGHYLASLR